MEKWCTYRVPTYYYYYFCFFCFMTFKRKALDIIMLDGQQNNQIAIVREL